MKVMRSNAVSLLPPAHHRIVLVSRVFVRRCCSADLTGQQRPRGAPIPLFLACVVASLLLSCAVLRLIWFRLFAECESESNLGPRLAPKHATAATRTRRRFVRRIHKYSPMPVRRPAQVNYFNLVSVLFRRALASPAAHASWHGLRAVRQKQDKILRTTFGEKVALYESYFV